MGRRLSTVRIAIMAVDLQGALRPITMAYRVTRRVHSG